MTTMIHMGTLVVTTCWCGIGYAIPQPLFDAVHKTSREVYCPLGHSGVYKDGENARLRAEAERLRSLLGLAQAKTQSAERAATAARAQVTKLQKRANAGVCLLCHRTFGNVARHMKTKHAEETATCS